MCDTDPFDVILATPVIANMWKIRFKIVDLLTS